MAKGKGNEMVIKINTSNGAVNVDNGKGEGPDEVNLSDLQNEKIKKAEACMIFHTNPCVYFMHGGRWYRVCY